MCGAESPDPLKSNNVACWVCSFLLAMGMSPQSVHVVRKDLYKERSSAFVNFGDDTQDSAVQQFLAQLDGAQFDGYRLSCQIALPPMR